MIEYVPLLIFAFFMSLAAVHDLAALRIPNYVPAGLALGFLLGALLMGISLPVIGQHLVVGFLMLLFGFTLFALKVMGGGDGKLLAAAGLWFGPGTVLVSFLFHVALFGGVLAIGLIFFRRIPMPSLVHNQKWLMRLHDTEVGMPYALAIAAGGFIVFPESLLFS